MWPKKQVNKPLLNPAMFCHTLCRGQNFEILQNPLAHCLQSVWTKPRQNCWSKKCSLGDHIPIWKWLELGGTYGMCYQQMYNEPSSDIRKGHFNLLSCFIRNSHFKTFQRNQIQQWMLGILNLNHAGNITLLSCLPSDGMYSWSPDSTNFVPPGNRTIVKIVLNGDWFSTKSMKSAP